MIFNIEVPDDLLEKAASLANYIMGERNGWVLMSLNLSNKPFKHYDDSSGSIPMISPSIEGRMRIVPRNSRLHTILLRSGWVEESNTPKEEPKGGEKC